MGDRRTRAGAVAVRVETLAEEEPAPLPDAVAVVAVLARTARGPRILLEGIGGPSGARLLGRFCHTSPELDVPCAATCAREEALDPGAIFAEVVHLPSGRMANILARPVLREWEIEWLGRSGAARERVLPASDLRVSLREDRVVLRSARLNRRVVPRLTSAHNWSRRSPGVYRFLCALQGDGRVRPVAHEQVGRAVGVAREQVRGVGPKRDEAPVVRYRGAGARAVWLTESAPRYTRSGSGLPIAHEDIGRAVAVVADQVGGLRGEGDEPSVRGDGGDRAVAVALDVAAAEDHE